MYLKGLLSNLERKSVEPIALQFSRRPKGGAATQNEVVALQGFVTSSPWEAGEVFAEIQAAAEAGFLSLPRGSLGQEIVADLPPAAWHALKLREGVKGRLVFEFAVLRVWAWHWRICM